MKIEPETRLDCATGANVRVRSSKQIKITQRVQSTKQRNHNPRDVTLINCVNAIDEVHYASNVTRLEKDG